jgi:hypothetical protein
MICEGSYKKVLFIHRSKLRLTRITKMAQAFQISLTSTTSKIVREYPEGIPLQSDYEVGLKHFVCWNTVYNINSSNNTLKFIGAKKPGKTSNVRTLTIPEGSYEIDDLLNYLSNSQIGQEVGLTITLSPKLLKIKLICNETIDFTPENSVGTILGFSKKMINANRTAVSDLPVEIFSINTIKICCNLVQSNIEDTTRNVNTLYDFPLDCSKIGAKIIKEPNPICYFTINTDCIYELVITITDQNNKLIDFRGETLSLTLDFRPVRWFQ